ncbi:MAG: ATP-binding cassette domain-containing protein [Elusimicrobiota bacterium]|jgi:D-methionine transport system ATP-binding protein|nr:ATP-binding cassette domain-containing protein [Elusimicrobiota bacterium]
MESFIEIKNVSKVFHSRNKDFEVLKNINLEVEKGDIYGIVGFSGAGKSTLIRCINRLENVTKGFIRIGDHIIDNLSKRQMNLYRQKIGIIFQHFNLLDSRTVFGNVAFPLEIAKTGKDEIKKKVEKILELVDMLDKKNFYPGQLSGGQKQRVGIARALIKDPDILLCDEATSALDPATSLSILDLLKSINERLGLTIFFITHSLDVIKYTCNNMAVLENGVIVEQGKVKDVFLDPKSETARLFIKIHKDFLATSRAWENGGGI